MTSPRAIGNDVVDLGDRPRVTPRHRRRFIERVFCEREQALLDAEGAPEGLVWSLFAAKEAAFKVVCKLGPLPVFAHRKFEVQPDLSGVRYGPWALLLAVDADAERVHALAWNAGPPPRWKVARVERGADLGASARALLLAEVGLALGCPSQELQVVRPAAPERWDGLGNPEVQRGGAPLALDVSLSHDGRFIACAF